MTILKSRNQCFINGKYLEKRQETVLQGQTDCVKGLKVTSDKKFVISGASDWTIRIWSVLNKRQEIVLEGHKFCVNSLAVTCDNKYFVSASDDEKIRLWNLFKITKNFFK